jgi:hypothetical protein
MNGLRKCNRERERKNIEKAFLDTSTIVYDTGSKFKLQISTVQKRYAIFAGFWNALNFANAFLPAHRQPQAQGARSACRMI